MTLAVQRVFGSPGKGDGEFDMPADAVVVEDELFVVDAGNNRIQVFELSSGRHRRSFGSRGVGPGGLNRPVAIAASPSGVLVADMFNSAIKVSGCGCTSALGCVRRWLLRAAYTPADGVRPSSSRCLESRSRRPSQKSN